MTISKSNLKNLKYGFSSIKKKNAVNLLRFFFHAKEKESGTENEFYIEIELLNPLLSPNSPILGFKSRVNITEEDLHSVLTGTSSAHNLESELYVQPSYVVYRICRLGHNKKYLCLYSSIDTLKVSQKPFSISVLNNVITDDTLVGSISVTPEELNEKPELLCNSGSAKWNLKYDIINESDSCYSEKNQTCVPLGLKVNVVGSVCFDNIEYVVTPYKSFGYIEHYWGNNFPETWFHCSSSDITSLITGKTLTNTSFSINGVFQNKISVVANIEGLKIEFKASDSDRIYNSVFDCLQSPSTNDEDDNSEKLHWSVSVNNKNWVIDIDIFCSIGDLYNRILECPDGNRLILNEVQTSRGIGELKIYKKTKNILEQIEYAKINKAFCEFGNKEEKKS